MKKFLVHSFWLFVLWCSGMFGAWLGGAQPSAWTFVLGAFGSCLIGFWTARSEES